jgi:hypothetical protein
MGRWDLGPGDVRASASMAWPSQRRYWPWAGLGENERTIIGENGWTSLGENAWPTMGENPWTITAREMTRQTDLLAR